MRRLILPLCTLLLGCLVANLLVANLAVAADANGAAKAAKPAAPAPPKSITVKPEPLKIEVSLKGIFEATEMTPVPLRPESWTDWKVVEAAAQGKRVNEGDQLVDFDTRKIDLAITEMEAAQASSDLARRLADESFRMSKKSVPLQLEAAARANATAADNLDYFLKIGKPEAIKDAHYNVEQNENFFLYEQEELRQLEKMYKEDDVTEETEEIILLRLQHRIKSAKLRIAKSKMARDRMLNTRIPREEQSVKDAAKNADLSFEAAKVTLPASLVEKRLGLEKLDRGRAKANESLARARRDRAAMTMLSPAAGLVYYGQCERGQWPAMAATSRLLRPHGALKPGMVVMTIVNPESMIVRVDVDEKSLHQLDAGQMATVTPVAFPEKKLKAELAEISALPISTGKFDGHFKFGETVEFGRVVPGMACVVKVTSYENPQAILLPKAVVQGDDVKHVFVEVDGKPQKRDVKTGKSKGDKIEIVDGLAEGDVVLTKKPAE